MTGASEVLPAEQPPPRAVVYLYSQTGQLREVAEALTAPLVARGWDIRWVDVQPRVAFPFPWPIRRFFGVFPAAVDPEALVELAEPAGGFETGPEELAILAYQVWYLAPSLPIRSLLKAHPEAFRNRRVVSLIACRNMWYSAAIEVSGLLRSAGARSVEVVATTDTRPQATIARDHPALAADRQARTLPVVRAGRGRRRGTRPGRRCGATHRRVGAVFAGRGPHRAYPGGGGSPCREGVSQVGRDGQVSAAIRRGGTGRELGHLRGWPGNRHRGRSAADRNARHSPAARGSTGA